MKKYLIILFLLLCSSVASAQTADRYFNSCGWQEGDTPCSLSAPPGYVVIDEGVVQFTGALNRKYFRAHIAACAVDLESVPLSGARLLYDTSGWVSGVVCDYEESPPASSCDWGTRPDGSCYPQSCPFGDCEDPNPDPPDETCPPGQSWGSLNGLWACWGETNNCPSGTSGGTLNGQFICYPDPGDPQGCPSGTVLGTINGHNVCYPDDYGGPGDGDGGDNGDGDGNGPPTGGGGGDGGNNGGGGSNGDGNGPPTGGGGGGGGGSNDGDDKGSASGGGDCSSAPTCEGDPILCAQLNQQWLNRCAMSESEVSQFTDGVITDGEDGIDSIFDGLEEGMDGDVEDTKSGIEDLAERISTGDAGNFLQSVFPQPSPCQPYMFVILDKSHEMDCELFEHFKVAFGYFLAVMTGLYIWSMAIKPVER